MFKIDSETGAIHCSRGDAKSIKLKIPFQGDYYEFHATDKITFNVYLKNGYDDEPVLHKDIECEEGSKSVTIPLTEEDTTFGTIANKPVTYWYDVTLNDDQTVLCYNEDGPKEFIQYPAKGVDE